MFISYTNTNLHMFVPFTESFMGDSLLQPMQNLNQSLVTSFLGRHGVFAGKTV